MVTYTTSQIAPLDANAGLQQNISVTSPSAYNFAGGSAASGGIPSGQSGPGWATSTGSYATAPASSTSSISTSNWGFYAVIIALAWFALKKLGG